MNAPVSILSFTLRYILPFIWSRFVLNRKKRLDLNVYEMINNTAVADPGGAPNTSPPPTGPGSFSKTCCIRNWHLPYKMIGPYGKSWIRPCTTLHDNCFWNLISNINALSPSNICGQLFNFTNSNVIW